MFAMKDRKAEIRDGKGQPPLKLLGSAGSTWYRGIDFAVWLLRGYVILQLVIQALRMVHLILI